MARPRAYEPDAVVAAAVRAFRRHGYAGTSLETLTGATGLGRGSLYAAFRDKRALFLAALADYARETVDFVERTLATADDPMDGVELVLRRVAARATEDDGRDGCLLANTAAELGGRDREVQRLVAGAFARLEDAYTAAIERARAAGRIGVTTEPRSLGRLLLTVMQGVRVMGASGASRQALQVVVDATLAAIVRERMPRGRRS